MKSTSISVVEARRPFRPLRANRAPIASLDPSLLVVRLDCAEQRSGSRDPNEQNCIGDKSSVAMFIL